MTLLHEATDAKNFDVRLLERNLSRGRVTAEAARKNESELPDDAENASFISIDSLINDENAQAKGEPASQTLGSAVQH